MKYGILAIGYNRAESMKRLLHALSIAEYRHRDILLIISIDNSGSNEVETIANRFEWNYGSKIVKTYENRMGLRKHIIQCGKYIEEYGLDAAAVFEDDIVPSPAFYEYMVQTVEFYRDDMNIAGISLYSHLWNVNASLPFQPDYNGADVYFMKYAQSWGQIWMIKQWKEFNDWYDKHEKIDDCNDVPEYVKKWPESSWLKYHIAYCAEQNKYFVYPYESLTTCFAEKGEHSIEHINLYQVPIASRAREKYDLIKLNDSNVVYDSFFERENLYKFILEDCITKENLCVDLYGKKSKDSNVRYWLTTKNEAYKIIKSYSFEMRPHENNIIYQNEGNDIFLYDSFEPDEGKRYKMSNILPFYFRLTWSGRYAMKFFWKQKINSIASKIKSIR